MPEIRVIVLTLIDVDAFRYTALAAGAAAFVSKVSAKTDLLSAIRTAAQTDPDESRDDPAPDPGPFNGSLSTLKGGPVYG